MDELEVVECYRKKLGPIKDTVSVFIFRGKV